MTLFTELEEHAGRDKYRSFSILVEKNLPQRLLYKDIARELRSPHHRTELQEALTEWGFRKVAFQGMGNHALVVRTTQGQLLRIVKWSSGEDRRLALPQMLQALETRETQSFRIEIMPQVETDPAKITFEHVEALVISLARQGYLFWDIRPENIGLLADGTPVVIDPGAVARIYTKPGEKLYSGSDIYHLEKFASWMGKYWDRRVTPDPSIKLEESPMGHAGLALFAQYQEREARAYDWEQAQEAHLEQLGLEKGKVKGVISKEELRRYRKHPQAVNAIADLIKKGRYLPEAQELIAAAIFQTGDPEAPPKLQERIASLSKKRADKLADIPEPSQAVLQETMKIARRILARRETNGTIGRE